MAQLLATQIDGDLEVLGNADIDGDVTIGGNKLALLAYPVGSVYISYNSTSPASLFGGEWTPITGVFPYFNAGTATGGSNTHTLTTAQMPSHNHTTSSAGSHTHTIKNCSTSGSSSAQLESYAKGNSINRSISTNSAGAHTHTVDSTGSGNSHNNMPAYQTFYAWRRTA